MSNTALKAVSSFAALPRGAGRSAILSGCCQPGLECCPAPTPPPAIRSARTVSRSCRVFGCRTWFYPIRSTLSPDTDAENLASNRLLAAGRRHPHQWLPSGPPEQQSPAGHDWRETLAVVKIQSSGHLFDIEGQEFGGNRGATEVADYAHLGAFEGAPKSSLRLSRPATGPSDLEVIEYRCGNAVDRALPSSFMPHLLSPSNCPATHNAPESRAASTSTDTSRTPRP